MKDYFTSVYKIWNSFTKAIRHIAIREQEEDLVINTQYFGKVYILSIDSQ